MKEPTKNNLARRIREIATGIDGTGTAAQLEAIAAEFESFPPGWLVDALKKLAMDTVGADDDESTALGSILNRLRREYGIK